MASVHAKPKIFHITHLDNFIRIAKAGVLWSDAKRIELGLDCEIIGMSSIKRRWLQELEVHCHPGTKVGEYVPFYFCPRSIMLYILHMRNHPELNYHHGQGPIVHLQADMVATIRWAEANQVRWAFSDRNAGVYFAHFYKSLNDLDKVNWTAVVANDWRDMVVKEGKQAEFLIYKSFSWGLVEKIGVLNTTVANKVEKALSGAAHSPTVNVEPQWYY